MGKSTSSDYKTHLDFRLLVFVEVGQLLAIDVNCSPASSMRPRRSKWKMFEGPTRTILVSTC